MSLMLLVLIAIVQGLTEFLPVSSSAHLIIAPLAFGVEPQSVLIDVMAHLGSLLAVMVYFRKQIGEVIVGVLAWFTGKMTPGGRLALLVVIATPPVMIAAAILYFTGWMEAVRSPAVIAAATLVFALPLWLADKYGARVKTVKTLTFRDAALIGVAQAVAMIPGSSRSGLMMTAARMLGAERSAAARFAMLTSIPVIAAFGLQSGIDLARGEDPGASLTDGLIAVGLSFAASLVAIHLLLKLIDRFGFLPFVIYRIALALAILAVIVFVV